jgi:membrane-associated phospholipid phosphatase
VPARFALALLVISFAALTAVCARHDLDISRALVRPDAGWAAFGERYGSLPGVYAIAAAAGLLCFSTGSGGLRALSEAALTSIALTVALGVSSYRWLDARLPWHVLAGIALVGWALIVLSLRAGPRLSLSQRLRQVSRDVVLLGAVSWAVVYSLKTVWGRVRYRDLDLAAEQFSSWYAPQGFTGHVSFPSGHTAMGWMLLPCLALWPWGSRALWWAAPLIVGWGLFVAASRVVAGAHYASDVLFSTALAVGFTLHQRQRTLP